MKKRRIIYTVDVDFPDHIHKEVPRLWADGIARGIEHNKDEVVSVEYEIFVRDLPEVERQPPDLPADTITEQEMRRRLELPSGEDD